MPTHIADALATIPPITLRVTAVGLFALAVLMTVVHTLITAAAAARAPLPPRARLLAPLGVATVLSLWLGVAIVVADGAHFPLAREGARLAVTLGVMFAGLAVSLGALATSRTLRAINAATPAHWLVLPQVYRLVGGVFLYPFLAYGVLPGGFAWPAGVGDMTVGALAPLVALTLVRGTPRARTWAVLWNVLGIVDLVIAPLSALASGAQIPSIYPLAIVPLFLGPPLGVLLHVLSLRNLWVNRESSRVRGSAGPQTSSAGMATARV